MKYTVDYFIEKFEAIPENEIGMGSIANHCALWHCGTKNLSFLTEEATALANVLKPLYPKKAPYVLIYEINDSSVTGQGKTPKQRILNALKKVKNESKN